MRFFVTRTDWVLLFFSLFLLVLTVLLSSAGVFFALFLSCGVFKLVWSLKNDNWIRW